MKFSCSSYNKHYNYCSRYDRHLASYDHRILEDVVKHQDYDLHLEPELSQSDITDQPSCSTSLGSYDIQNHSTSSPWMDIDVRNIYTPT